MYLAHFNDGSHMDASDWGLGLLMMLIWALVFIAIVLLVIRAATDRSGRPATDDDSLAITKKRYAKGEISKKEFDQLKKDLISK